MSIAMFPTFHTWTSTPAAEMAAEVVRLCTNDVSSTTAADSPGSTTITRLVDLLDQPEEDDHGVLSPTQHSFKTAYRILDDAEKQRRTSVRGSVSTDSEGGVRVTWSNLGRVVKLVCPPTADRDVYLYRQAGDTEGVVFRSPTPQNLSDHLHWLTLPVSRDATGA